MKKVLFAVFISLLCTGVIASGKKSRTSSSVKKEQTELNKQITKTQTDIESNKQKTLSNLNQLNLLNSEITQTNIEIDRIRVSIDSLTKKEKRLNDSIAIAESTISKLKKECSKNLRDDRRRRKGMSEMGLLFSAETFQQAMKRSSYIRQLNKLATDKAVELKQQQAQLEAKHIALTEVKQRQSTLVASLEEKSKGLNTKKHQTEGLIGDLQKEASTLNAALKDQKAKAQRLESELNRIIAEEIRQAEEARKAEERRLAEEKRKAREKELAEQKELARQKEIERQQELAQQKDKKQDKKSKKKKDKKKANQDKQIAATPSTTNRTESRELNNKAPETTKVLSGSFSSNRGNLIFPVSGKYQIVSTFGVHKHQSLKFVETENSGIDIEAQPGANARSAFDGTVSSIFYLDGFHNIVMVRHGEYLTVYANLENLAVKKGDKVKGGQTLGKIYSDPQDNNRTILHFEVRRETQKLNPLEWVRR